MQDPTLKDTNESSSERDMRRLLHMTPAFRARARKAGAATRLRTRYRRVISRASQISLYVAAFASLLCMFMMLVYVGFEHDMHLLVYIKRILRGIQSVFLINIVLDILNQERKHTGVVRFFIWVVDALMILTVFPWIYPHPVHPWIPLLEQFFYSNLFLYGSMAAYSVICLSITAMQLMGRRTNPALMMAGSFIFFIVIGSFLLMMPKCTYNGIDYIDSLFVATSGVCITGLTTVDIPTTFTPLGQLIICILFQIGGLGVLTFTSFFAIFFSGRQSIYSQLLLRDMVYSKTLNNLVPTLLYILGTTFLFEAIGAVFLFITLPDVLFPTPGAKFFGAVFQSMSAFCNVGFSNIEGGMHNAVLMYGNQSVYIVMSVLLFLGAMGFPLLVNLRDIVTLSWKNRFRRLLGKKAKTTPAHILDLNTKIALTTTLIVLAVGTVSFFVLESDNTLKGMSLYKRVVQSVFNSLIPRSGGYDTVNPADFRNVTLLLVMIQMWIGGASQSMGGGVKVNTVGTIFLNLRSIIRSRHGVAAFHRRIDMLSVRRANAIVTLSLIVPAIVAFMLMLFEPQLPTRSIIFETVSATFSVGSSLGITPYLSMSSKILICFTMFIGRVGLLSLLTGLFPDHRDVSRHYPTDQIIIN